MEVNFLCFGFWSVTAWAVALARPGEQTQSALKVAGTFRTPVALHEANVVAVRACMACTHVHTVEAGGKVCTFISQ